MNFSGTSAGLVRQGCLPFGYGPLPIELLNMLPGRK